MESKKTNNTTPWYIYILQCCDGSLYTGSTTDLMRRVATHNSGKGSKYTRAHLPVELLYSEEFFDQTTALKREWEIKQLPKAKKILLIKKKS